MQASFFVLALLPFVTLADDTADCKAHILAQYTTTTGCSSADFEAYYDTALILLSELDEAPKYMYFCEHACYDLYITAIATVPAYEAANSKSCAALWGDGLETDTEPETDTDEWFINDSSEATIFYKAACDKNPSNNEYCLPSSFSLLAADEEPSCSALQGLGCCASVLVNCYVPEFLSESDQTAACSVASGCSGVDLTTDTCGSMTNGCDLVCISGSATPSMTPSTSPVATPSMTPSRSTSPSPSPARVDPVVIRTTLSFNGLTCADFNANTITDFERETLAIIKAELGITDAELSAACTYKQSAMTADLAVYTDSTSAGETISNTIQSTAFKNSVKDDINTALSTGSLSSLGITATVSDVGATTPTVATPTPTPGTSGTGMIALSGLASLLAIVAHWLL